MFAAVCRTVTSAEACFIQQATKKIIREQQEASHQDQDYGLYCSASVVKLLLFRSDRAILLNTLSG